MKKAMNAIVLLFLFAALSGAFAQRGGGILHWRLGHRALNQSASEQMLMEATNEQRMALVTCMDATKRVRLDLKRIPQIGSPWSRSRKSYNQNDLVALSNDEKNLQADLIQLSAVHQEFHKHLTAVQRKRLDKRLDKLNGLRSELRSQASRIADDLAVARPGPASPNLSWDVNALAKTADKWRSEHIKIAKEMNISELRSAEERESLN